jgi:hypothetical protein
MKIGQNTSTLLAVMLFYEVSSELDITTNSSIIKLKNKITGVTSVVELSLDLAALSPADQIHVLAGLISDALNSEDQPKKVTLEFYEPKSEAPERREIRRCLRCHEEIMPGPGRICNSCRTPKEQAELEGAIRKEADLMLDHNKPKPGGEE